MSCHGGGCADSEVHMFCFIRMYCGLHLDKDQVKGRTGLFSECLGNPERPLYLQQCWNVLLAAMLMGCSAHRTAPEPALLGCMLLLECVHVVKCTRVIGTRLPPAAPFC